MILSKEQINRYFRHIIMPEISLLRQKKLLESTVVIYGENVKDLMPLTLYLSAMGIGNISCYFEDDAGYESLFSYIMDLNTDVEINLIKDRITEPSFRIVIGSCNFIKKAVTLIKDNDIKFIPTIISATNQWKASLQTFKESQNLCEFIEFFNSDTDNDFPLPFVSAVSGAICSIEGIKLCLDIGNIHNDLLMYDLFNLEFNTYEKDETEIALKRFYTSEDINYGNIKEKFSRAKVLIVGAGGLGSPAALALALAGVGTINLVDYDSVELSNLNRQVLHATSRIGMPKAESAKFLLNKINPDLIMNTYFDSLTKDNIKEIIDGCDLVISAVDNIHTRYLINDSCYFMKKPVVEAGVLRFDGTNTTIIPDEGHCYRCLYPNLSTGGMSCAETGVLGAVPGVMGFIQAAETYKVIAGEGVTLKNKILMFDGLEMEFNVINLEKNPDCPICGKSPTITELQDYTVKCGNNN